MSRLKLAAVTFTEWLWAMECNHYGPPSPERDWKSFIAWYLYHWGISK